MNFMPFPILATAKDLLSCGPHSIHGKMAAENRRQYSNVLAAHAELRLLDAPVHLAYTFAESDASTNHSLLKSTKSLSGWEELEPRAS